MESQLTVPKTKNQEVASCKNTTLEIGKTKKEHLKKKRHCSWRVGNVQGGFGDKFCKNDLTLSYVQV